MLNVDGYCTLYNPITMEELKEVLFHFKKDNIPGPNEWMNEFFTFFFYLVGEDLLGMVEESRRIGSIVGSMISTFLTLISKTNKPSTFDDFRLISLCNLCYKVISKIIAN